tara:strand:+ start:97 stop:564 length:468 start_codon:yes stop_codon:yes gene_type:complete
MRFKEKGIDYIISEISFPQDQNNILNFINNETDTEKIDLPLPKFGCIVSIDKVDSSIVGYVGGHHAYAKKFYVDIFVIAPYLYSMKIGFNMMLYFWKYMEKLGFNRGVGLLQPSNKAILRYYKYIDIPYEPCFEVDLPLTTLISKFEDYRDRITK